MLASVSVSALSNVRAYVGGESLWTKGQKDAIYYLSLFVQTRKDDDYRRFQQAMAIPLGDRAARWSLERPSPDLAAARAGFLAGGNDSDDVPGMIFLFLHARQVSYFADAVEKWRATDAVLDEFLAVANDIRHDFAAGDPAGTEYSVARIERLNERATPLAVAFSRALGAGSRAIATILIFANVLVACALLALIVVRTRIHLRQRREFERALHAEKERATATLDEIGEAVIRIDAAARVRYVNPAGLRLLGITGEAVGARIGEIVHLMKLSTGAPLESLETILLGEAAAPRQRHSGLGLVVHAKRVPIVLAATRVEDEDGAPGAVLVLHDISREQETIDRLSWLAAHDPLTELPNRREFERRVDALFEGAQPETGHAVALIDLDEFKSVNDTGGHAAGDALLRFVAEILLSVLRPSDFVGRLGGDEFGVALTDCSAPEAIAIAESLRSALERTAFVWEGRRRVVTASIGLVTLPPGRSRSAEVFRAADAACYRAKEKGRNRVERWKGHEDARAHPIGKVA